MASPKTIAALIPLYRVDRDLQTLKEGLENAQRASQTQRAKIDQLRASATARDDEPRKLQAQMSALELDMKVRQEHIEKMRDSLNTTKGNKEYSAILVQISAEKAEVSKLETAILELMGQVETGIKNSADLRAQIKTEETVLIKVDADNGERVRMLQAEIADKNQKRQALTKDVTADALKQYDRVSQRYPGDALASVDFDDSDLDNIGCGSCYMSLTTEDVNLLRGRDDLRRCNSCGRILYLPEMLPHGQRVHAAE